MAFYTAPSILPLTLNNYKATPYQMAKTIEVKNFLRASGGREVRIT